MSDFRRVKCVWASFYRCRQYLNKPFIALIGATAQDNKLTYLWVLWWDRGKNVNATMAGEVEVVALVSISKLKSQIEW